MEEEVRDVRKEEIYKLLIEKYKMNKELIEYDKLESVKQFHSTLSGSWSYTLYYTDKTAMFFEYTSSNLKFHKPDQICNLNFYKSEGYLIKHNENKPARIEVIIRNNGTIYDYNYEYYENDVEITDRVLKLRKRKEILNSLKEEKMEEKYKGLTKEDKKEIIDYRISPGSAKDILECCFDHNNVIDWDDNEVFEKVQDDTYDLLDKIYKLVNKALENGEI